MNRTTCPNLVRSCPVDTDGLNRTDKPSLLEGCPVSGVRSKQKERASKDGVGAMRGAGSRVVGMGAILTSGRQDDSSRDTSTRKLSLWRVWACERDDLPRHNPRLPGDEAGLCR